ncbi:MAG: flagellar brake protein [Thiohalomonadales bacterium]
MEKERFALDVGDNLQMQFLGTGTDVRHYVQVIGYLAKKSVLVSAPMIDGKLLIVREGKQVICRLMVGNDVVGFSGSVLRVCSMPYHYLHLSYPFDMQTITVRKALRVSISMLASSRPCRPNGEVDWKAALDSVTICDLSTTGALMTATKPLGEVGRMISITMRLDVAGEPEDIMVPAVIRNIRPANPDGEEADLLYHGVELQVTERKESVLLHAFVYEQISRSHE